LSSHRLGLVDLGSNSARLVVFEVAQGRGYRLADEIREVVRLGEGLAIRGALRERNMQKALTALRSFHDYAEATGLPALEIMATSAVREAENGDELLSAMRDLGLEVRVLSGEEEAELGVVAVANASVLRDAWVVDLGGGSAQVSRMRDRRFDSGGAHPLGALRTTEAFLVSDPARRREVKALEAAVDEELGAKFEAMRSDEAPIVAMGGTVRNLARAVAQAQGHPWPLLHGFVLEREALEDLTERLAALRTKARGKVPGINGYRAETILAGAIVFRRILERSGRAELRISGVGVREGALYCRLLDPPHLLDDVRDFSVQNLQWHYPQAQSHVDRVSYLAGRLFEELEPLHRLGPEDRLLLEAAARLHDIGKAISYRDHHKHGFYLVRSTPLFGFRQREQAIIALLVRYHRSGSPKIKSYRRMMEPGDLGRLRSLAACLRLAEYLERTQSGRVLDVHAEIDPKSVALELVCEGEAWVEYWEAKRQRKMFRRAFDRKLDVRMGPS
jgi:exopolyphosphatase/guanosine-5'-triphosphate,3'-diphosphate pyrophosphatase